MNNFECPRCGHCCHVEEEHRNTLRQAAQRAVEALDSDNPDIQLRAAIALRQALVDADDTSQKRVDEKEKREHEPVAEIQVEDMGKPFNAIRVTVHFYAEVPAVGTKLYKAPPKRDLTCVCGAVWEGETMVHPPRKREWVGLHGSEVPDTYKYDVMFMEGWLWAEERLKEKNT